MPIPISCPICGARLSVPDTAAGKQMKCPKCLTAIPVPAADPGFEVVQEAPSAEASSAARPALAKPVAARPARPRPVEEDEEDDRPRRRIRDEDDDEEDRPVRRKPKKKGASLPLLIVGGALGLFLLIGAAIAAYLTFLGPKDDKPRFPGQQPAVVSNGSPQGTGGPANRPPPPAAPTSVPAGWKTFSPPGTGLTVSVPTMPRSVKIPGRMRRGGMSLALWQEVYHNKVYQVQVVTMTTGRPPSGPVSDQDLDKLCEGFISSAGLGPEKSRTTINMGGHKGRQIVFAGAKSEIIRLTLVGRHLYVLSVITEQGALNESDAEVAPFLESAKING